MTDVNYMTKADSVSKYGESLCRFGFIIALVVLIAALGQETASAGEVSQDDRTWSVNIGPNAKNWGYAGIAKDYLVNDSLSYFVTGGLGTILIGGGVAYYTSGFHENSAVFSATLGLLGWHADAAYQWKTPGSGFVTAGVSYGLYFIQYQGFLPVLSWEHRF